VPVNAIMGGTIAQEVIKAISKKNEPIKNLFLFDGNSMNGEVMKI
jgi:ubiquitin-like 1-activating enzyme E1 A